GAWVLGARSVQKALLYALLEPIKILKDSEERKDYISRLGIYEGSKTLPFSAVWDYFCFISDVPPDPDWFGEIKKYEKNVLSMRKDQYSGSPPRFMADRSANKKSSKRKRN
ncbi:MAG: L-rhamnose isomerase, partial [candidate division WOR-3 bacterium]